MKVDNKIFEIVSKSVDIYTDRLMEDLGLDTKQEIIVNATLASLAFNILIALAKEDSK